MVTRATFLALIVASSTASAAPPSILGGKMLGSGTAHHIGLGSPSLSYEWWQGGARRDWGIGGELVYGEWSGAFSKTDVGIAANLPMRFPLSHRGIWDIALKLAPGVMFGDCCGGRREKDRVVFGVRAEGGVLVGASLAKQVNLVTGGSFPVTFFAMEDGPEYVVIPLYGRIGVEVMPARPVNVWLLIEMGPAIAIGDFGAEIDPGFRAWLGATVW
ncbi:MAG: hypothetical protein AABZ30_05825 [Myxococcota bacterium]